MRLDTLTYSQLRYNPAINARGNTETDLTELCATLRAKGIGQPLLVRPADDGMFEPVEGGRRFHALGRLITAGQLPADHPIPVLIRDLDDAEAIELSLATAVTRVPLNPADEAEAFARLVADGTSEAEIAAIFGVTAKRVSQRLAIAQLPKVVVDALRSNKISIDMAQAFTVSKDAGRITKLFKDVTGKNSYSHERQPSTIRSRLTEKRVSADCKEAKFVGLDAYREAGGGVDEDLFSNNAWLTDGKLLQKLFAAKLKTEAARLKAEGWSFVEVDTEPGYRSKFYNWVRTQANGRLTSDQKTAVSDLETHHKKVLQQAHTAYNAGDRDEGERLFSQAGAVGQEIAAIRASTYTAEQRKKSGVLIEVDRREGRLVFGVMEPKAAKREEKAKKSKQKATAPVTAASKRKDDDAEADFTGALNTEMAKAMTEAMQWAITNKVGLAKRALAVVLALAATGQSEPSAAHVVIEARWTVPVADLRQHLVGRLKELSARAGGEGLAQLITEALKLSDADADAMLAEAFALSFAFGTHIPDEERAILQAFDPDVAAVWEPNEDFFKRMPRESLAAALGEAAITGATPSKKKKELIEMCLGQLLPLGWLPKPLRTPSYKGPGSNAWADAKAAQLADQVSQQQAAE